MKESSITLPVSIIDNDLTFAQIGAIAVIMSAPFLSEYETNKWQPKLNPIISQLINLGFVFKTGADDHLIIDSRQFTNRNFWELRDYDNNGNPTYAHISDLGEEDSWFEYELIPCLVSMKICYECKPDSELSNEEFLMFESMEDATEWVIDNELKLIKKYE